MNTPDRSTLVLAQRIYKRIAQLREQPLSQIESWVDRIVSTLDNLRALQKRLRICRFRQWQAAAAHVQDQISWTLDQIPTEVAASINAIKQRRPNLPTLRQVLEDLDQLRQEFGEYDYDRKAHVLSVSTDPITLEGVYLGAFEIALDLGRLTFRPAYRVIAEEPNHPSSNHSVTHPHVSDEHLCEGEATLGITAALQECRLCDFFLLVRSVLQHYNPDSPFVSLSTWSGIPCSDCGHAMDEDESYTCDGCEETVCGDCIGSCQNCDVLRCGNCLTTCPACEHRICGNCEETCSRCHKGCCSDCIEDDLCPECQKQSKEQPHEQPKKRRRAKRAAEVLATVAA